jgi:hypothetical protein
LPFAARAVQSGHAIIEANRAGLIPHEIEHPHLIILEVANEARLCFEAEKLQLAGIPIAIWREPDRDNEITAIATAALYGDQRKHFRKYQLLKEPNIKNEIQGDKYESVTQ